MCLFSIGYSETTKQKKNQTKNTFFPQWDKRDETFLHNSYLTILSSCCLFPGRARKTCLNHNLREKGPISRVKTLNISPFPFRFRTMDTVTDDKKQKGQKNCRTDNAHKGFLRTNIKGYL